MIHKNLIWVILEFNDKYKPWIVLGVTKNETKQKNNKVGRTWHSVLWMVIMMMNCRNFTLQSLMRSWNSVFSLGFWFGVILAVLKVYSWLCTLSSLLVKFENHTGCWKMNPYWPLARQSPRHSVLFLRPHQFFSFFKLFSFGPFVRYAGIGAQNQACHPYTIFTILSLRPFPSHRRYQFICSSHKELGT